MKEMPNVPSVTNCFCYGDNRQPCVCGITEKALRGWMHKSLPAMTHEQREWCLKEIDSVEGFERKYYEEYPDDWVANGVLQAWTDYCRDKGLL